MLRERYKDHVEGKKCQVLNTLLSVEGKVQGSCGGEKMSSVAVCASCLCPVTSNAGWKEGAMQVWVGIQFGNGSQGGKC